MAGETSNTQQVLAMPEILQQVFEWIKLDKICKFQHKGAKSLPETNDNQDESDTASYQSLGVLARCSYVNKAWWLEAARLVWEYQEDYDYDIPLFVNRLSKLEPQRRQTYANFVATVSTFAFPVEEAAEIDELFQALVFPRLKWLQLRFTMDLVHAPRIQAPTLSNIVIDPDYIHGYHRYALSPDQWDQLLERLPVLHHDLKSLVIQDWALLHDGALERFSARLPRLQAKRCDFHMVTTSPARRPPW